MVENIGRQLDKMAREANKSESFIAAYIEGKFAEGYTGASQAYAEVHKDRFFNRAVTKARYAASLGKLTTQYYEPYCNVFENQAIAYTLTDVGSMLMAAGIAVRMLGADETDSIFDRLQQSNPALEGVHGFNLKWGEIAVAQVDGPTSNVIDLSLRRRS